MFIDTIRAHTRTHATHAKTHDNEYAVTILCAAVFNKCRFRVNLCIPLACRGAQDNEGFLLVVYQFI
jgi:hypothetical protein